MKNKDLIPSQYFEALADVVPVFLDMAEGADTDTAIITKAEYAGELITELLAGDDFIPSIIDFNSFDDENLYSIVVSPNKVLSVLPVGNAKDGFIIDLCGMALLHDVCPMSLVQLLEDGDVTVAVFGLEEQNEADEPADEGDDALKELWELLSPLALAAVIIPL